MVPDYNIGFSVLAAGDNPNRQIPPVRGPVVDIFVRIYSIFTPRRPPNLITKLLTHLSPPEIVQGR